MYAVGFVAFYYPMLSMVNEFWIARRGMAYGLLCSASGVAGAVLPFAMEKLLQKYGYSTTLRITAGSLFVLTGPLIPLLKGRLPESGVGATVRTDWSFLKVPPFWIYSASNLAMGLGYFFPSLYLPSYAVASGMSTTQGAVLLAVMSVAQVLGQFSFGWLSDGKLPINLLAAVAAFVGAAAAYTGWGLAHSFPVLIVFAIVYGFFAAGYTALWGRMGTAVASDSTSAFTSFGLLCFGKGIGNVLAGPLSGALLSSKMIELSSYGLQRYEGIVVFTGSCLLLSSAVIPLCRLKWRIS